MMFDRTIRHCRQCGAPVARRLPDDGDTKLRAICTACHTVHYENPLNVVGTVPHWGDQVLLCKRNIEPRKGKWTLPAGFMELGETTSEGAARETTEEAGAQFDMHRVGDGQTAFGAVELEAVAADRNAVGFPSGREAAARSDILRVDVHPA